MVIPPNKTIETYLTSRYRNVMIIANDGYVLHCSKEDIGDS